MKKYLALFLAALMLLSLAAGCALTGGDTQTDKPETSPVPAMTDGGDSDLDLRPLLQRLETKRSHWAV